MTKKILFVGDGNHQFILNLVLWLKKSKGEHFQMNMFSYTPVKKENKSYYEHVYTSEDLGWGYSSVAKIWGIRRYYRFFLYTRLLKQLPKYDYIHFHFLDADGYFLSDRFRNTVNSSIIFTIWGSDLYRLTRQSGRSFFKACKNADEITFTNNRSLQFFKDKYDWQNDNLSICRFGLAPLETLKNLSLSKSECKKSLDWNTEKLAVVIGYNLSPAQQHLKILDCFKTEELSRFKDDIQLIVPLTYQGTDNYKADILDRLSQLPFEYTVYEDFMSDEEVAYLRKASDVMIQLQITDQFSGSMLEHLFAENVVITGSWLPYETLKEEGAWFIEINQIDELVHVLPEVLLKYGDYVSKMFNTRKAIARLALWDHNIDNWVDLYK